MLWKEFDIVSKDDDDYTYITARPFLPEETHMLAHTRTSTKLSEQQHVKYKNKQTGKQNVHQQEHVFDNYGIVTP